MLQPIITLLDYSYQKSETGLWVLNADDIPVDKGLIKDQQIVHFQPLAIGGNHKHPRTEWFIGIGNLIFYWLDSFGMLQELKMNPNGNLLLIEVPPLLPHTVINQSKTDTAVLFEYADAKQHDVEKVVVKK